MDIRESARRAKDASRIMAALGPERKLAALEAMARALGSAAEGIFAANREDLEAGHALPAPLYKRLSYDADKLRESLAGIGALSALGEPVGIILSETELDTGLVLRKTTCPIGVIGMIFESRPDALVQMAALCLKSGNAVILKGGSEASTSNRALADVIARATEAAGCPPGWLSLAETREDVASMLKLDDCIDLLVPRGSNAFVRHVMDNTRIPVLGHANGIIHAYVDEKANIDMAIRIVLDSKTQYPSACNALETLLVHESIAHAFLPMAKKAFEAAGVELRGCERARRIVDMNTATEQDWDTEYLDLILSVRVVDSIDEAIRHINVHGSGHTETIITADPFTAELFMDEVDSADVFWNASTRFSDGYRYGLGAEVGISTSKIHARGPVGLDGLLSCKWRLYGTGQIVADYAEGRSRFTHRKVDGTGARGGRHA